MHFFFNFIDIQDDAYFRLFTQIHSFTRKRTIDKNFKIIKIYNTLLRSKTVKLYFTFGTGFMCAILYILRIKNVKTIKFIKTMLQLQFIYVIAHKSQYVINKKK